MEQNTLLTIIKDKIASEGSLSISDYMELCLAHPEYGYYTTRDPLGATGDFTTSPEISQIFGELIGLWCAAVWQQMGSEACGLVELGPGRGTLMADALRASKSLPEFHASLTVHMVETSPKLANTQYHNVRDMHPHIEWLDTVEQLPKKPLIIIANEFFDALPIKQFVKTENGMQERKVTWNETNAQLEYCIQPAGLSLAKGDDGLQEGQIIESAPLARSIMHILATHLATYGGAALVIDYGYSGVPHGDTLQAVKSHGFASILGNPGEADLTAHVDFSSLMEVAKEQKLNTYGTITQGEFLRKLGAEIRAQLLIRHANEEQQNVILSGLHRLMAPEQMGELFKVIAITSGSHIMPAGF